MTVFIKSLLFSVLANVALLSTGSIVGTIEDTNGNPISGAEVELIQNQQVTYSAVIDGDFTLDNVPSGTYTIEVCKQGYECTILSSIQVSQGQVDAGVVILEDDIYF